jgi:[ribosomal protein S5]-alanine N-acetyltransferase
MGGALKRVGGGWDVPEEDLFRSLEARNVLLRPLNTDDYREYRAAFDRNREHLEAAGIAYQLGRESVLSEELFDEFCRHWDSTRRLGLDLHYGVFEDGQFIGHIGLTDVQRGFQSSSLMAWIDETHSGKQRVEEAFALLCDFAFRTLKLHRVECAVLPDNTPVLSALDNVGVREEGPARALLRVQGSWKNCIRYVVTEAEWDERKLAQPWLTSIDR